jgi:mannose-6-phosphate isomerase-like protein (cupin superfamily)
MVEWLLALLIVLLLLGAILDWVHHRIRPAPDALYPPQGSSFTSAMEGVTQEIVTIDGESAWLRSTLGPHAPGPPPHVHAHFPERVRVTAGRLTVELKDGPKVVGPGEEFLIAPGMRHQLCNRHAEEAVVEPPREPEYALPRRFTLFLSQAYGFFDEDPRNARPPRALFQLAFWSPMFDVWLPGPPIPVQRVLFALVRPVAFLLGYRPWYARFAPQRSGA